MPTAPKTQRPPRQPKRPSSKVPIHGAGYRKWREVMRPNQLAKQPLCERCLQMGKITMAEHVDHIVPRRTQADLLADEENLQSLCHSCHSRKTMRETR